MNWTQIEGNWDELRGKIRQRWGELTDDDLEQIKGRRDRLIGKLKERYGEGAEQIGDRVDRFIDSL
ncbi:MAG: CsbD family protein [Nannocystaceae bacterium]|nr:CsbD family protein [Myxococcales bacterium]